MGKAILKLTNLTKYYNNRAIFKDVNLEIGQEVHAIVGSNAAGKTSLLKMFAGFDSPSKGKIIISSAKKGTSYPRDPSEMSKFKMAYAGQDDFFLNDFNVKQNIVLGNEPLVAKIFPNWKEAEFRINSLMTKYKIKLNLDKKVSTLAIEELKKLSLLRALFKEPKILLLDEPTVGLSDSQKLEFWMIFKTLRSEEITVIFTTRDEEFAKAVSDRVSWIKDYQITNTKIMKLSENTKMFATDYWSNVINYHKPQAVTGVPLLYVDNLAENNPNLSDFHDIEFVIAPGEIYGIYDFENLYSEVLIDSLVRINKTKTGRIFFKESEITKLKPQDISNLGIDWVSGQYIHKGVIPDATLFENFTFWNYNKPKYVTKSGVVKTTIVNKKVREIIKDYKIFDDNDMYIKIQKLSKGELQKFVLARSIEENPQLLILSNPFCDLDEKSARLILEKLIALRETGASILIIDTDPYLLQLLCQRVAVMYHKQFVCKLANNSVKVEIMNNPARWQEFPITNEIVIKTDKMYRLPQTKWSVKKEKLKKFINYISKPMVKLHNWINKKLANIKSRLG
ncbi:ATP-binding cassette domain-containing protein [Spiroplasma sp. AdecLV25b]|uniref:ATP-binding cassette domain-containing protein n=1 Tax=Spiroplasma sp. AdecLV25b TaxID=3027162 RepID=UPI0027E08055|nr:ATP-binding cassette domain-containing protein [Spiroplasma sp. AdecLV25b]